MDYLFIVIMVLIFGLNTLFWAIVGAARLVIERVRLFRFGQRHQRPPKSGGHRFEPRDVAILIPAHNERAVLAETLAAALPLVPRSNIHVVSDGSTDATVAIANSFGVNVLDLNPNRGKAGAVAAAIEHFGLVQRFKVMLLVDADTLLEPDYLETGLPLFDDGPNIVAVAGWARGLWDPPPRTLAGPLPGELPVPAVCRDAVPDEVRPGGALGQHGHHRARLRVDVPHRHPAPHQHHRTGFDHRGLQHDLRAAPKEAGPHRFSARLRRRLYPGPGHLR